MLRQAGKSARSTQSLCFLELLLLHALIDHHRQVATDLRSSPSTRRCAGALIRNRSFDISSSFDGMVASASISLIVDHAAFDHTDLEGELRRVLGVLGQRLGHRDRIAGGVGDRSHARQSPSARLRPWCPSRPLGQRVLRPPDTSRPRRAEPCAARSPGATVSLV